MFSEYMEAKLRICHTNKQIILIILKSHFLARPLWAMGRSEGERGKRGVSLNLLVKTHPLPPSLSRYKQTPRGGAH